MMVKKIFIASAIVLFSLPAFSQISQMVVSWDYSRGTFQDFVTEAEKNFNIRFYYRDEWVNNLELRNWGDSLTVAGVLDNLFLGRELFYSTDKRGNIIITRGYAIKSFEARGDKGESYLPPVDYTSGEKQKSFNENVLMEVGNVADRNRPGNAVITGFIRDKNTQEALIGVAVYIRELSKGTVTNEYGLYSLSVPRGTYNIKFSSLGLKEVSVNASIYGNGKMDIEMAPTLIPLKEAVVTADRNNVLQRFEVGLEKISIQTVRLMPTSLGETDVLKSMLLLPGVKTVGEGSSGFNVRGGSADQNLILLYGAPVFNSSHFFGFFSSVNSDIIKDVLLYKGGIPAQYGGRVSSVIDIVALDGNKEEFRGNAGISPITAHLFVEMPVVKEKMSVVLAARSTYSNWVLKMVEDPALRNSMASFYDFNGRIVYEIDNNNRLELSSYLSHDAFRFNSDTLYSYNNRIISARWRHSFNPNFYMISSANTSMYDYSVESKSDNENAFVLNHKLSYVSIKNDFNWFMRKNQRVNFGIDLNSYSIRPGDYLPAHDSSLIRPEIIDRDRALEGALYIDDKINISDKLSVNIGLRYSLFASLGPRQVQLYLDDRPRSQSTVYDTLVFGGGDIARTYSGPEYRASFNYMLSGSSSVKINYNRTRQYLNILSNTTSISPTDTWKLCDYYLRPQTGDQISAGFYQSINKISMEWSAEVYYKKIRNMIDFKGGTNLIMNENIEKDIVSLEGKAYGIEMMLRKKIGKTAWNLSYTYSRILVRSVTDFDPEKINSGNWFPASYDKPNDFTASCNYTVSRRLSFSFNYTYSTGRPVTYPVAVYQNEGKWLFEYSDRNKYRIPDYSRLDFSARLSGNLKSRKLMNPFWTFSCYNVLGRENVYSVYFTTSGNSVKAYKLSVFARAIPTLTYSFDF